MNPIEFFKNLIRSNSGYSSKRFSALILLFSGIIIPVICIFINPLGVIDDSILILSCQLLAAGCGLLGFTLKETSFSRPINKYPEIQDIDKNQEIDESYNSLDTSKNNNRKKCKRTDLSKESDSIDERIG